MRQIIPPRNKWFLPAFALRLLIYLLVRLLYSVKASGKQSVPQEGPAILVANHVSYVDVLLLQAAYPRYIYFVAHEYLFRIWWLGWFLRMMEVVPIQPRNPRQAFRNATAKLLEGHVVCLFPEGQLSQSGCLQRLKPGFKVLARQAGCPVQAAFIDGIWGSIFSYAKYRFLGKRPLPFRHPLRIHFGPLLQPGEDLMNRTRESLLDLSAEAFSARPGLEDSLGSRAVRALARSPWKPQVICLGERGQSMSRGELLGMAIAYSKRIRTTIKEERIGLAFESGTGGALANLAVILAGKIPVNLGVRTETNSLEEACRLAGIATIIAPSSLTRHFDHLDGIQQSLDLSRELNEVGEIARCGWIFLAYTLPGNLLACLAGMIRHGGDREAARFIAHDPGVGMKCTSVLHRNLMASIEQISSVNFFPSGTPFLTSWPLSHSLGVTLTLWHPLVAGMPIIPIPDLYEPFTGKGWSRMDVPTVLFGSSISPRLSENHSQELQHSPILFSVLPSGCDAQGAWHETQANIPTFACYGLPEATALVSVNLPNPPPSVIREEKGHRQGSVGRLLPGITARIVSEDGSSSRPLQERGRLLLQGANIRACAPDSNRMSEGMPRDVWLDTGVLARFEDDGFLFLEANIPGFARVNHLD